MAEDVLADRVSALDNRLTRVETNIAAGFDRIERMLRSEINDLKSEQITDLREANKRLGDDQRRLWEAVEAFRRGEDRRLGASKALLGITHFFASIFGGLIAGIGTWIYHK